MEIMAVIIAVVLAFLVMKFIGGMVKFAILAAIIFAIYLFMTGGFGA